MKSFSQWMEINLPLRQANPNILYHHSPVENRESILKHGLLTMYGARRGGHEAIFLTDKPKFGGQVTDVWEVNVRGLPVQEDITTDLDYEEIEKVYGNWYAIYEDIPPERLRLIS